MTPEQQSYLASINNERFISTRARFGVDRPEHSQHSPSGTISGKPLPEGDWKASQRMTPHRAKRGGR